MKKQLIVGIFAVMIAIVFGAMTANAAPIAAKLTRIKGSVMVKSSPSADWVAGADGMKLAEGASVKTGAGSEAYVVWKDNAVKVNAGAVTSIDSLMEDEAGNSKTQFGVSQGTIFAKAGKMSKASSFNVKTPTAVAGVRGTGFEGGIGRFAVVEGTITVSAGGVEVEVKLGMLVEVSADGVLSAPIAIPPGIMQALQSTLKESSEVSAESAKEAAKESKKEDKEAAKESKKEDKEETKAEAKSDATAAVEATSNVMNTVDVTAATEQAGDAVNQFLAGHGGLQGTINIQLSNY